jgi:hypothetical protein
MPCSVTASGRMVASCLASVDWALGESRWRVRLVKTYTY